MTEILVVDDRPENNYLLEALFGGHSYTVVTAENGEQALHHARKHPPSLIIADILMPVMDGFQLCRECKADPTLVHIPFIFYTATYTGTKDKELALDLGADRFLIKPVEPEILLAEVEALLKRPHCEQTAVLPNNENVILKEYNAVLIKKLERKMIQLEASNAIAQDGQERLQLALEAANAGVWDWDIQQDSIFTNDTLPRLLGLDETSLSRNYADFTLNVINEDKQVLNESIQKARVEKTKYAVEFRVKQPNGTIKWMASVGRFKLDNSKVPERMSGIVLDITERKRAEQQLLLADTVFENCREGIFVTDKQNLIEAINPAFTRITGYNKKDVIGRHADMLQSDHHTSYFYQTQQAEFKKSGYWHGELRLKCQEGKLEPVMLNVSIIKNKAGENERFVYVITDMSDIKQAQERLSFLAHHDPLTSLPNRQLFNEKLQLALARANREQSTFALLFMDLDSFKTINDSLGHRVGDLLLISVAERLLESLRETDTVARIGGDEFNVIMENCSGVEEITQVAQRLIKSLNEPIQIEQQQLYIGVSIGIAIFPFDGRDILILQSNADSALYKAKDEGRNKFRFFSQELADAANERMRLDTMLRQALLEQCLTLFYQPQVTLEKGTIIGVEALARWPVDNGFIPPDKFIPLAEENGLIVQLGHWALMTACKQMRKWADSGAPQQFVAVNVSAVQLVRGNLLASVDTALKESGIKPSQLEIEITESFVLNDPDKAISVLSRLRDKGVNIAVDDFGTGYSSLSYLKKLPVHRLKIDREFIIDMLDDANDEAIVRAIIAMGTSLGLDVLAEGVETEQHAERLREMGCNSAQGWLYGRPMPAN